MSVFIPFSSTVPCRTNVYNFILAVSKLQFCAPICRPCLDSRCLKTVRWHAEDIQDKESVKDDETPLGNGYRNKTTGVIAHDTRFASAFEEALVVLRRRWVRMGVGGYVPLETHLLKTVEELEGYSQIELQTRLFVLYP